VGCRLSGRCSGGQGSSGEPITAAPLMIFVNMSNLCTTQGIHLLAEIKEQVAPLSLAVA
jgi:hypothetical protein